MAAGREFILGLIKVAASDVVVSQAVGYIAHPVMVVSQRCAVLLQAPRMVSQSIIELTKAGVHISERIQDLASPNGVYLVSISQTGT